MLTMRNIPVRSILLLALALIPASLAAKQPEEPATLRDSMHTVRYEIQFMDLHAAEVLAWDQCAQKERCRVATATVSGDKRKGFLEVGAEPAVQEKIARALAREDTHPRTHGFQIVLLSASVKPGGGAQEVPVNVQKALADLKGFLPFKTYEVLDTAWMSGTQDRAMEGRLVDHQGAGYQVTLQFHDTGSPTDHSLFTDVFRLRADPFRLEGAKETRPGGSLIDTSFGLKEGETLVVGTSKVVGGPNDALVVLVTAVPAP
jgi:hypothetical protein